jgi:hypothetical protein
MRRLFPAGGPGGQQTSPLQSQASLRAFVGIAVAGAAIGGTVGIGILARGTPAAAATLGQAVPTSFGVISVDQVERLAASNPDRDVLVPGMKEVQVAVTMTNLLRRPLRYSRGQLSLRVGGSGLPIPVSSASISAGELRGGAAFRTVYRFDVPNSAADLWVRFDDPGRATPIWVDLGSGPIPVGLSSAYNVHLHAYSPHQHGVGP